ncbi:type I phosphomannose isomerase catalytic subunit [Lignipirellula cremea]|uniref:Putative mannose-6-phosphate isomerase GmuF n=1 Tax=Lignipirellula cremea TaxID=2528010 RepID=A0A518DTN9_9BACT|nr:type I phosphomannose isomerase catalytic subunit [Lignipirellula cremea]QDU95194.1 putative mannose-6-phosphate isomerase GmuF [Lignipirellula cremea]
MTNYPLRFEPIIRRAIWGGRRLETVLDKRLGDGDDFAEAWEVVDHGDDQSVVTAGPLAGKTLHQLVTEQGPSLLGRHYPQTQFPLLFKFLDAHKHLSVQVHPDDAGGALLDPPDLGKTEAWIVMHAEPDSLLYAGLKRGFDRPALEREMSRGTTELCLHRFTPAVGDCLFIPAGTVHALGAGVMVAEIQQASDTTFRLFDWNRVGADGQPRALHIDQGLDAIDYQAGPVGPVTPEALPDRSGENVQAERLVACDKFVLDRYRFQGDASFGGDDRCHILAVLEGETTVAGDPSGEPFRRGQTLLLPAGAGAVQITSAQSALLLDMYLPDA